MGDSEKDAVTYALTFAVFFNIMFTVSNMGTLCCYIEDERRKHSKIACKKYQKNNPEIRSLSQNSLSDDDGEIELEIEAAPKIGKKDFGEDDDNHEISGTVITLVIHLFHLGCSILLAYAIFYEKLEIVATWLYLFPVVVIAQQIWRIVFLMWFTSKRKRMEENKGLCNQCCCTSVFINVIYFVLAFIYLVNTFSKRLSSFP